MGETVFRRRHAAGVYHDQSVEWSTWRYCCSSSVCAGQWEDWTRVSNPRGDVIRISAVRARLKVDKPDHERGSGTGREWDSATLNTESSSRPGNRPDRSRVPVVDVRTMKLNATAVRRGARAGVISTA